MGNVNRQMETLKKEFFKSEKSETAAEMKNAFEAFNRLDMAKGKMNELKNMQIETPKLKGKKKINSEKERILKNCGKITKGVKYM